MGISNVGSGLRPGICTSTTRPTTPYEGQMIYETDTNRVLVWDNAAWVMIADTDTPPGLDLVATLSFSGSSNPFINGCFSSNYDNYKLVVTWYGSASTNIQLRLRYGTNTSQTGNQYYRYGFYYTYAGTLTNFQASNTTEQFVGNHGTTAGVFSNTEITMLNPYTANQRTVWNTYHFDAQSGLIAQFTSQYADTTQYTGFEFIPASGTVTGTVRVYGFRNAV